MGSRGERLLAWAPVPFLATRHAVRCIANSDALHVRPRSSSAADVRCVPGFGPLLLAPSHRGLVRIRSASAVGALGPHHLGGVLLVENLVAVAAFKCLLDHGGLLFRRGMRFGRAAVRASCPPHGKARLVFLENKERPDRRDGDGLVNGMGNGLVGDMEDGLARGVEGLLASRL